jgi:4-hydroxy-4-methyl-2-oxoglutarate aldolase
MAVAIHPSPSLLSEAEIAPWRKIPVAVAADLGPDIALIDCAIRPLRPPGRQPRLVGRAVTALCEPPDFGAVLWALEQVGPGDVLVIAANGARNVAMIGEILSGHLRRRGGVGVVCDGAVRDVATLAGFSDFSVFSRSITPRGPTGAERGAVNVAVTIGGARVSPGDLILGDDDGLVALTPDDVRTRLKAAQAELAKEGEWIAGLEAERAVAEVFGLATETRA